MALTGAAAWVDSIVSWAGRLSLFDVAVASGVTVVAIVATALARRLIRSLVVSVFSKARARAALQAHGPSLDTIDRLESLVRKVILVVLIGIAVIVSLEAWGFDTLGWLLRQTNLVSALAGLAVVVVVAVAGWIGVALMVNFLVNPRVGVQARTGDAREQTVAQLLISVGRFLVVSMAILLGLSELGLNIGPLIAGAGIVGLAVGFGAQSLVKDVLTGFMVVLERSIAVGDVVGVAGHAGKVERLGLRSLRLRGVDGTVHIVPYGEITTIENQTQDFGYALLDISVGYREDTDRCAEVMQQVAAEMQADPEFAARILAPMEYMGVEALRDSAVILRGRIQTRPFDRWAVAREYNRRIKARFDAMGIEIPYPYSTVVISANSQPLNPSMLAAPKPTAATEQPDAEAPGSEERSANAGGKRKRQGSVASSTE